MGDITRFFEVNPHLIIGKFIKNYEEQIKPAIEKGDLIIARGLIQDGILEYEVLKMTSIETKKGVFGKYNMALMYLSKLLNSDRISDGFLDRADRYLAEVGLLLRNDEAYKKSRYGEK